MTRINGFKMPENFEDMAPEDQWRAVVIHCKIKDASNIMDILSTPIPKESLLTVFPNAGRGSKVFDDVSKITMPLSQLRALEESLANDNMDGDVRKTRRQMDMNNKRLQAPVKYEEITDDLTKDCHPRLFHNFPLVDPMDLFKSMAKQKIIPIATDLYPLHHINGGGCVTMKGWFEAANLGSTTISIKDFLLKNALRANSGARRITSGQEGGSHFIETDVPFKEVTGLQDCMEAFSLLMMIRRRACPADLSLEPLHRFLAVHAYFCGDKEFRPQNVNAGAFSAGLIDKILHLNGMRYNTRMPFLSYSELYNELKEYKMTFRDTRTNELPKHDNKPNNSNSRAGKGNNACFKYNSPKGNTCKTSGSECTGKYGAQFKHLCNCKHPDGNLCNQSHPASQHTKTKTEKE